MAILVIPPLLAFVVLICGIVLRFRSSRPDPREPPIIPSTIPLVGHLIGLVKYGGAYYMKLSAAHSFPIYTLRILGSKIYVVNSLELIAALSRKPKTISFIPYVKVAAQRLSSLGSGALKHFDDKEHGLGLSAESVRSLEHALGSVAGSEELGKSMLRCLESLLEVPRSTPDEPRRLLAWLQHAVTQSSSTAIYGPQNPIAEAGVEEDFWTFELNMGILLIGFIPNLFKRKVLLARSRVVRAYEKYYRNHGLDQGSIVARSRYNPPAAFGLSVQDIAKLEVTFLIAVLNNTVASAFWVMYHVFSTPDLLFVLRAELSEATTSTEQSSAKTFTVNIAHIKHNCPILLSTYQEVLRFHTIRPITRKVLSDVTINDRYFLQKGATIQMSTRALHEDTAIWGPDAHQLDFHRFMRKDRKKPPALAFGSFGSAPSICPGRQVATTQILALVALMMLRYDVEPVAGKWKVMKQDGKSFATVTKPVGDVEVVIRERDGWRGEWKFELGEPGTKFALASG